MLFDKFNVPLSDNEQPPACKTVNQAFTKETDLTLVLFDGECDRSLLEINRAVSEAQAELDDPNRSHHVKQYHTAQPEQWLKDRERLLYLARRMLLDMPDAQADRLANLPRTQDLHLHRTQQIILAKTGSILRDKPGHPTQMRLELLPCYDSLEHYRSNIPVRDIRSVRVTMGRLKYGLAQPYQQNRGIYVRTSDIVPGGVYCDSIGEKYLFLGRINVAYQTEFEPTDRHIYLEPETSKSQPKYIYIRLTPELEDGLRGCGDLNAVVKTIQQSVQLPYHILGTVLLQDSPKRFQTHGCALFRPEHIRPITTAIRPPAFQYSYDRPTPCVAKRTHKILLQSLA